jgi:DNA-binding winged helix-turn-helix (wHTH) protein
LDNLLPTLHVLGPNDETFTVELTKTSVTIGRFQQLNDIGLEPDPQMVVTRVAHCIVEREADTWWVIDNGSVNKTFVRREDREEIVRGRAVISHGDVIHILGKLTEDGKPVYWELTFLDPLRTNKVIGDSEIVFIDYDWIQAKLFRIEGSSRQEIRLRPQEHKLIRYMDQRNNANNHAAVMCTHDELIAAVWGEEEAHTGSEINHLIFELRKKIELDPKNPRFLEAVRGQGYRLVTHPSRE